MPISGLLLLEFDQWAESLGEKPFRARQIADWLYRKKIFDPAEMTNLSKAFRAKLALKDFIETSLIEEQAAPDGTLKLLLEAHDNARIECVLIPDDDRATGCLSSQIGCPIACAFCRTGQCGFVRNLETHEIVEQFLWLEKSSGRDLTNAVLMGMGEPLLNMRSVLKAIEILHTSELRDFGARRFTLSTVGLPDMEERLLEINLPIYLAISLHAPNDRIRSRLVPNNQATGIEYLTRVANSYFRKTKREVTMEYVLLKGVNDQKEHADELASRFEGMRFFFNLIPFNACEGIPFASPDPYDCEAFRDRLACRGINSELRRRRGADIQAACGQLAFKDALQPKTFRTGKNPSDPGETT